MISKCGIYTSKGKRVLLATRAVVNGRKAVAYVKNGKLQGYEYLDDFAKRVLAERKKLLTEVYDEYTVCKKKLEEASLDAKQQARELSFLQYEIDEIDQADLKPGEDEQSAIGGILVRSLLPEGMPALQVTVSREGHAPGTFLLGYDGKGDGVYFIRESDTA